VYTSSARVRPQPAHAPRTTPLTRHNTPFTTQLRDQEARLGALVDEVVSSHSGGFAKSIQTYSVILQLFGDAKEQVSIISNT
jgi:Sec8 exocyst complex component specific domain